MKENKEEAVVGRGVTLYSKHLSLLAGAGILYSVLVFLSGYIVGHRKAAATFLKRFQTENMSSGEPLTLQQAMAQTVMPTQCISLGYFGKPEQAHDLARWGEKTTDLSFKVCECPADAIDAASSNDSVLYHVISETCSNGVVFDAALRRLVPYQERPECHQFRLLTV